MCVVGKRPPFPDASGFHQIHQRASQQIWLNWTLICSTLGREPSHTELEVVERLQRQVLFLNGALIMSHLHLTNITIIIIIIIIMNTTAIKTTPWAYTKTFRPTGGTCVGTVLLVPPICTVSVKVAREVLAKVGPERHGTVPFPLGQFLGSRAAVVDGEKHLKPSGVVGDLICVEMNEKSASVVHLRVWTEFSVDVLLSVTLGQTPCVHSDRSEVAFHGYRGQINVYEADHYYVIHWYINLQPTVHAQNAFADPIKAWGLYITCKQRGKQHSC